MTDPEKKRAPLPESTELASIYPQPFLTSKEVRSALRLAMEKEAPATPENRRLRRLHECSKTGELSGTYHGEWVAQLYEQKKQEGEPTYITKKDVNGRAIVLTAREVDEIGVLCSISPDGELIEVDSDALYAAHIGTVIIFPDELGDYPRM